MVRCAPINKQHVELIWHARYYSARVSLAEVLVTAYSYATRLIVLATASCSSPAPIGACAVDPLACGDLSSDLSVNSTARYLIRKTLSRIGRHHWCSIINIYVCVPITIGNICRVGFKYSNVHYPVVLTPVHSMYTNYLTLYKFRPSPQVLRGAQSTTLGV